MCATQVLMVMSSDVETDVVFFLSVYIMGFDEQTNVLFTKY